MGCCSSSNTAVRPLRPEEKGDEDEAGSKVDGRGDSAVSKGTTDSGVVMDNRDIPVLPGAVPTKLPPQDGMLQQASILQERPKSSEILEELLNQGIIPVGQTRERSSMAGEADSIMLDGREVVRRKPPARLESLTAKKVQSVPSIEDIEEKIQLAEERPMLREDKLKMRLRIKSAHVRGPAPTSNTEEDQDTALTPVEPLQLPPTPNPLNPRPHSQITREEAEGGEWVREADGDDREGMGKTDKREGRRVKGGESAERVSEDGDRKGEETQVEELKEKYLLTASQELESDSSFQHAEDNQEMF
ncbi:stathmin domain-containing protein 1 [Cebidichthys violaceus]|uniref:stathmin domain-containing protein 1 n=1 Tax=Cebidichthys violaceus TaxID=271503 RepID=UPI0035CC817F